MGEVYLALDERLGRRVALKFVKTAGADAKALERFHEEARTTARFNHPHIVTVYASGDYQGRPWLALEYLDGETLRERLERGPMTVPEALRVAKAIAEALAEAHRHDVVHADLKPENVLLPRDGRVRVLDFGLSRLAGTDATAASGTPAYMAPERWSGSAPRAAMDLWALGVLLHEAIEGRRPFSDQELAQLVFSPRPLRLGARVRSAPCSALVAECLRMDPNERPSATDVIARIDRLLSGREVVEGRSPFRGLEAFSEQDAPDFHGRAQEIDAALERLRTDALVPIVGPSGVGKTSFVYAGVLPRLRESGAWEVVSLRPGRRPWVSLAAALGCEVTALEKPAGLVAELRRRTAKGARVLLLIDQFEELVTLGNELDRLGVLRALALAASPEEPWRIMVTVRSDFLGAFVSVPELSSTLQSVLVLRPLGRAALEAAVTGPLSRAGHAPDDPSLPAKISAELEGQAAALPLLQFACQALWERRDAQRKQVLRREYDSMGGAVGALATHAERLVSELLPEDRRLTRSLMLRLVNPDGTRKPRTRAELIQGLAPEAGAALDRLVTQRLLVTSRQEDTDEPLLELAHESLVSTWPQLTRWLQETQESRTLMQEIEQAALIWDKRGRREDETWANEALQDVLRRVEKWNVSLTSMPRDFLEAGRARQARLAQRRRLGVIGAFAAVSLVAVAASVAALEFREKEREAIAQQELIRLASGDVGRFELVLEPFDWDPVKLEKVRVSAADLPSLDWRLHRASRTNEPVRGGLVDASKVKRSARHLDDGRLVEIVEMGRDPVFFEFVGRGEGCGSSWLFVHALPGYAERTTPPQQVRVPVPTCGATLRDTVRFTLPDGGTFALDRTEAPSELWSVYASLTLLTGDQRTTLPPSFSQNGRKGLPLVGVTAFTAERFCSFFGRRLPTVAEWMRAARSHPQLTGKPVSGCVANLEGTPDGADTLAPVGSCAGDVTEEGIVDLLGNVSEWTSEDSSRPDHLGLRNQVGASWAVPPDAPPASLSFVNVGAPTAVTYSFGVRCVSE